MMSLNAGDAMKRVFINDSQIDYDPIVGGREVNIFT